MSIKHMQMVFDAEGLTHSEKVVLLAYCNYTDAHGYVWAGVERIGDDTGASASTIKRMRAALKEKRLLASKRRIDPRTGESIPNLTRINLARLEAMQRAKKTYDDNVIEALTFEEEGPCDTPSDLRMGQDDPRPDLRMGQDEPRGGLNLTPPKGGVNLTPNPSDEPSGSSSSGSGISEEDEESPSAPGRGDRPADLIRQATDATDAEAAELVEIIRPEAKKSLGGLVRTMAKNDDLDHRLWLLRAQRASQARAAASETGAPDARCGEHHEALPCSGCKGAPRPVLVSLLKKYGPTRRPDLAVRLGAFTGAST